MESNQGPVVVIGATGKTGLEVVKLLLSNGRQVRAVVRDVTKLDALKKENNNLEVVTGDISSEESMEKALKGSTQVVFAAGGFSLFGIKNRASAPYYVDNLGVKNTVNAMKKAAPKDNHFLLVSSALITRPWHPIHILLNVMSGRILTWKLEGENYLRKSGLNYTIVRPGGLVDTQPNEKALLLDQGDKLGGTVSRADVARVCVAALGKKEIFGKTFEMIADKNAAANVPPQDSQRLIELFSALKND